MVFSFLGAKGERDTTGARFSGLAEVRAYWEGRRNGIGIPSRADLDPRGMAGALEQVFIAERIGTGLVRLRIAGSGLAEVAGLDMKGLPLSALITPESRLRLAEVLERVFTQPIAADLHLEAERAIGRPALQARLMLLPLRSAGGARDLVLGCLATGGTIGRAPRRFAITRAMEERLIVDPTAVAARVGVDLRTLPGLAEPATPAQPIAGKPHLRLVYSVD
ncbi:MAG: PAS domain-containing protein [Paracoccaceae bacterium]